MAVGLMALAVGLVVFASEDTGVDASGEGMLVSDLATGDCFDNADIADDGSADSVDASACPSNRATHHTTPRSSQSSSTPPPPTPTYPGTDAVFAGRATSCALHDSNPSSESSFEESVLDLFFLVPACATTWLLGDRTIHCVAARTNNEKLTETVIDSGL